MSGIIVHRGGGGNLSGGMSDLGNTSGTTGTVASQLIIVGGNNVTLSQSVNGQSATITISAPSGATATGNFGALSASNNLYSTGTVVITGGTNITLSTNGQTISVIGPANILNSFSIGGNSGTTNSSNISNGGFLIAGGNNITLSQSNNSISIHGAAAQTVQTQNLHNVTLSGNTAGVMAQVSSGTLTLAGGNNITLSQNGNAVTISGPNTVAQTNQTLSAAATGNTAGNTSGITVDARSITTQGLGAASVGFSTSVGGTSLLVSVPTQTVQTQNVVDVTLSGNTAGVMALVSSGTMTLAGGNNITLSQNGNAITISGANVGGAQTGISSIAASNTTYTSGGITITGSNAAVVRSTTGQGIVIDVPAAVNALSLSGNTATTNSSNITSGGFALAGGNGVTLQQSNNTISVSVATNYQSQGAYLTTAAQSTQTLAISLGGNSGTTNSSNLTAGGYVLAGGNNVTLSQSNNSVSIHGAAQTAESNTFGISNLGNTSGTSGTIASNQARLLLAGGNNITLSQSINGGSATITISGPNTVAQTNQTLSYAMTGNTTGNTSGMSVDARSLTVQGLGGNSVGLSTSAGGSSLLISGVTTNGLISTAPFIGVSTGGNTLNTSGVFSNSSIVLAGGNNITLSAATAAGGMTVTISGPNVGGAQTGISSIAASNTTYTSGGITITGSNAAVVRSTTGQGIVIDVPAAVNALSLSGNTATTNSSNITSGGFALAGGNNVTLQQSNNTISISVGNYITTGALSSQTLAISLGGNTATTNSSQILNGGYVLAGGNNVTIQQSNNTVSISAANQTVQTQNIHNVTLSGNTAGVMAQISSGTMTLAGGNNITLSQNGNAITISGVNTVAQTNQTLSVAMTGNTTGNTSGMSVDARSLTIQGLGGNSVGLSTSAGGSSVIISGVTTNGLISTAPFVGISGGNTVGDTGAFSNRTVVFAGGNNITLSGATGAGGASITISGPNVGGAQTGISSIAASNTTYTSGGITITGSNAAVVRSTTGQGIVIDVPAAVNALSLSGNTATTNSSNITSGGFALAGGNNVTLQQSNNTISISVGNYITTGALSSQTLAFTLSGNSATTNSSQILNGGYVLAGGANVTLQQSNNTISISAAAGGGGNFSAGVSGGNTSNTSGMTGTNLALAGGNNITLSQSNDANGATVTISGANIPAQTNQTLSLAVTASSAGNTSGMSVDARSLTFMGSGQASVGLSTSAGGSSIFVSVPAGASATGNFGALSVSNNLYSSGTVVITGGTNITLTTNGQTVSVVGPANILNSMSVSGNTATTNSSNITGGGFALAGGANVTLQQSNNTISVSVAAQSVQTQNMVSINGSTGNISFANSNNITFGFNASTVTASFNPINLGVSNLGNTAGTTGTMDGGGAQVLLVGTNNITLSQSSAASAMTITVVGPANILNSMSISGNTATTNSSNITGGGFVLAGGNNITLAQSNNTISISAGPGGNISQTGPNIGVSDLGNTAGSTGTVSTGNVVFAGLSGITLSQSTAAAGSDATISIIGPGAEVTMSGLLLAPLGGYGGPLHFAQSSVSLGQNSLYIYPVQLEDYLTMDHIRMPVMVTNSSSANASVQKGYTYRVGIYTRHATNKTVLTQHYSTSYTLAASHNSNASWMLSLITAIGNSTSYNTLTASSAGLNLSASLHGAREFVIPVSSLFAPGEYWFGVLASTSSAGAGGSVLQLSNLAVAHQTFNRVGGSTNATSSGWLQFMGAGTYSTTTGAIPGGISMTQINQIGTLPVMFAATGTV